VAGDQDKIKEGGCSCGQLRYRMMTAPLFIHCCHCTWCQRETGAAFALNALIESDQLQLLLGRTETIPTPSSSGLGQDIVRCVVCKAAIWSHYGGAKDAISFLRLGTLDDAAAFTPDIHIFTSTKQPWIELGDTVPVLPEYYRRSQYWPEKSIIRYKKAVAGN